MYYTALLVNVGCHTDAHEQAKWFGDDIALKADKYAYEQRSVQGVVATMRKLGSGNPPLHRVRTGLEFALGGFRDLDGMINQHSKLARSLGEQLDLPVAALDGLGGSYERWDGKGWPGELAGADIPITARIAQLAEFVEVAHRTGGVDAATSLATKGSGTQFDPELCALLCANAEEILSGLDSTNTWDAVIAAEPALGVRMSPDQFDAALLAVATFVDLKSPYMLGHATAVSDLVADAGAKLGLAGDELTTLRRAGVVHGLGRSGSVELHLGQAGTARRRRAGTRPHAALPDGTHAASVTLARAARRDRGAAPRAARRLGLPARPVRRGDLPAGAHPRRGRRVPGDVRTATPPRRAPHGRQPRRNCEPRSEPDAWTETPSKRCSRRPAIACPGDAKARPASPPARSTCSAWSRAACPTKRSRRSS